jgi:hypothetical protein
MYDTVNSSEKLRILRDFTENITEQHKHLEKAKVLVNAINPVLASLVNLYCLPLYILFVLKKNILDINIAEIIGTFDEQSKQNFNKLNSDYLTNAVFDVGCSVGNFNIYLSSSVDTYCTFINPITNDYDILIASFDTNMLSPSEFIEILAFSVNFLLSKLNTEQSNYDILPMLYKGERLGIQSLSFNSEGVFNEKFILYYYSNFLFNDYNYKINSIISSDYKTSHKSIYEKYIALTQIIDIERPPDMGEEKARREIINKQKTNKSSSSINSNDDHTTILKLYNNPSSDDIMKQKYFKYKHKYLNLKSKFNK